MEPQKAQPQISSKDLASNLGFATHLLEQQIPKDDPQAPQQEQSQEPTQTPEQPQAETSKEPTPAEPNPEIQQLTKDMAELGGKMEGMINSKFDELTKKLQEVIK